VSQNYVIGPRGPGGTSNAGHGAALYLPGRKHPQVMIANTGATTIYVNNEDPISDPSAGQPLTPGSSLGWDADRSLYMTCPTSGTVTITENSGTLMDAGAIASQIISQGLADDIASAIYISGIPPVDRYTLVQDTGVVTGTYFSPMIDVTGYQSMNVVYQNGATIANPGNISITWYAAPTFLLADVIGFDDFFVGTGILTNLSVPIRGPFYQVNFFGGAGGGQMKSYGSYKAVQDEYFIGLGSASANGTVAGGGSQGMQHWNGSIPIATNWTWQPDVVACSQQLVMRYTTTSQVTLLMRIPTNIYPVVTYAAETNLPTVNGQTQTYNLVLPPCPVELSLTNTHAANPLTFRATLVNTRPYSG